MATTEIGQRREKRRQSGATAAAAGSGGWGGGGEQWMGRRRWRTKRLGEEHDWLGLDHGLQFCVIWSRCEEIPNLPLRMEIFF
jgi:hypothetical protein